MQHNSAPVLCSGGITAFFTVGITTLVRNAVHSAVDIEAHTLSTTGRELITDLVQVKLKSFKHFIWTFDNATSREPLR